MDTMADSPFEHICRTCTMQNRKTEMISLFSSNESSTAEMFTKCTSLEVNAVDGLPSHICKDCYNLLTGFFNFRVLCISSDAYFKQKVLVKLEKNENDIIESSEINTVVEDEHLKNESADFYDETNAISAENDNEQSEMRNYKQEESDESSDDNDDDPNFVVPSGTISDGDESNIDDGGNDNDDDIESAQKQKKKKSKTKKKNCTPNEILPCSLCSKKFFKKHRLEAHIRQHKGLKPCVCSTCGKEFAKFSGLTQHMNAIHTENAKSYVCDYKDCERTYTMKQSLNNHIRKVHRPKPIDAPVEASFMCELCGKSFTTNSSLKKHIYTHTGLMPFKCTICPKKYATKHKLKEHTMRHEGVKNHICPFCGLRKTTPHELKVHINYHTREKLYPCKFCTAVFSSIGNMSRHVKIVHCGIKAYDCSFCDRSFGKAETLKHHVMTHTGEKPHVCTVCGKRFIQSIALQTHMKTHTKTVVRE